VKQVVATKDEAKAAFAKRWRARLAVSQPNGATTLFIIGNRHPLAVHFDFVVVTNHATLGRATIHQVAA
jgi:hypothetical protein